MNLSDYSGFDGFSDSRDAQELLKAMQAGNITGRDTANLPLTQEPLKAESLEKTLKLLTFRNQDIRLFNEMPKMTAYNTVEEFLQLESYGSDRGGFYNEGELSDVEDSVYRRRAELVKYVQVTGEVTYQAQAVRSYVDAMQKEIENKMMWVLRKTNSSLTKADSDIVPQEFNSIYRQHASIGGGVGDLYATLEDYYSSPVVIDLRGRSLTQDDVETAAITIDDNFGNVDTLFAPPSVVSGLAKDFFQRQRIMLNASSPSSYDGVIGTTPKAIATSVGDVRLLTDKFMKTSGAGNSNGRLLSASATSLKAPNQPNAGTNALTGADAQSKFVTADAGTVYYAVGAINRYGESALRLVNATAVTLTAGQSVDVTFTDGGGAVPASGYQIYRTKVTASADPLADNVIFYPLFKVSTAAKANGYDGAAAGVVRDRNRILPDTEQAFVTQNSDEVYSYKQLAPISKMDLAILSMARRFIVFQFGTPQLYAPKKLVRFVNVGKYVAPTP